MAARIARRLISAPSRSFFASLLAVCAIVGLASGVPASAASTYGYDASTHAYDGADHSVQAHTNVGPVQTTGSALDGGQATVATTTGLFSVFSRLSVAANSAGSLIGRQYGVGTVVENPGIGIEGFGGASDPAHALNQVINRGLSPTVLRDTVANPTVVLQQGSGNYLYLTDDAAVVLRPDGQMVTAYGSADFRPHILDILSGAAG